MSAPGLDRLFTNGFYGTATTRFVAITTGGWYDEITEVPDPILLHTTTANRRDHALTASRRDHSLGATRRTHSININQSRN